MSVLAEVSIYTVAGQGVAQPFFFPIAAIVSRITTEISVFITLANGERQDLVHNTDYGLVSASSLGTTQSFEINLNNIIVQIGETITAQRTSQRILEYENERNQGLTVTIDDLVLRLQEVGTQAGEAVVLNARDARNTSAQLPAYEAGKSLMWSKDNKRLVVSREAVDEVLPKSKEYMSHAAEHAQEATEAAAIAVQTLKQIVSEKRRITGLVNNAKSATSALNANSRLQKEVLDRLAVLYERLGRALLNVFRNTEAAFQYSRDAKGAAASAARSAALVQDLRIDLDAVSKLLESAVKSANASASKASRIFNDVQNLVLTANQLLIALTIVITEATALLPKAIPDSSSGVITGFVSTVIDNDTVEYSAGEAQFFVEGVATRLKVGSILTVSPLVAIPPANPIIKTHVYLDSVGGIVRETARFDPSESYRRVYLGIIETIPTANTKAFDRPTMLYNVVAQMRELFKGTDRLLNQTATAIDGTMQFELSAAKYIGWSVRRVSASEMKHEASVPSQNPAVFDIVTQYVTANSIIDADTLFATDIELPDGQKEDLIGQQAVIYDILRNPAGDNKSTYPQEAFQDLSDAQLNVDRYINDVFLDEPALWKEDYALAGAYLVKNGATDLNDPTQALWIPRGGISAAAGGDGGEVEEPSLSAPRSTLINNPTQTKWVAQAEGQLPFAPTGAAAGTFVTVNVTGTAHEAVGLLAYTDPKVVPVNYMLYAQGNSRPTWMVQPAGGGEVSISNIHVAALEQGQAIDYASNPAERLNIFTKGNLVREVLLGFLDDPENQEVTRSLLDAGILGRLYNSERYAATNRGYLSGFITSDISLVQRAATLGTDATYLGGLSLGQPVLIDPHLFDDGATAYGFLIRENAFFIEGAVQSKTLSSSVTTTIFDPSLGDFEFALTNTFAKVKAIVIQWTFFDTDVANNPFLDISGLTIALFGRDSPGDAYVPVLSTISSSNELVVPAGTFLMRNQRKYVYPFNTDVSWPFGKFEIVAGTLPTIADPAAVSSLQLRVYLVEDSNIETLSAAEDSLSLTPARNARYYPYSYCTTSSAAVLHNYFPALEFHHVELQTGLWDSTTRISSFAINTSSSTAGESIIYDIEFAAEEGRWRSPSLFPGTLFSAGHAFMRPFMRGSAVAAYFECYTSGTALKPDPVPISDLNIYPLDANVAKIDMVPYMFVLQGTGVADPADFTDSTIKLLDAAQDPIITLIVTTVTRPFDDDDWDSSQRIASNDAFRFNFNIIPYPTAAFFTEWGPNAPTGLSYTATKVTGFYESIPVDPVLLMKLHNQKHNVRRYGTKQTPLREYVGGKYRLTGRTATTDDRDNPESWPSFWKHVNEDIETMAAMKARPTPATMIANNKRMLSNTIPKNTLFIKITVNDPSDTSGNLAAIRGVALRVRRSEVHRLYGGHPQDQGEDTHGIAEHRGPIAVFKRFQLFRENNKIVFKFMVIANTHPRVEADTKTAHYKIWHTRLDSIMLEPSMIIENIEFISTLIVTKEVDPNAIHHEVWHDTPAKVIPSREIREAEEAAEEEAEEEATEAEETLHQSHEHDMAV